MAIEDDFRAQDIRTQELIDHSNNFLEPPPPPPPPQPVEQESPDMYWGLRSQPEIIGGETTLHKNLYYPKNAKTDKIDGKVVLRFICSKYGIPQDISVLMEKPKGYGFGDAAISALQKCRFKPAFREDNVPVTVRMVLPIKFSIDKTTGLPEHNPNLVYDPSVDYIAYTIPIADKQFEFLSINGITSNIEEKFDNNQAIKMPLLSNDMFELLYENPDYIKYFLDIYDYHTTAKMVNPIKRIGIKINNIPYLFE